MSEKSKYSTLCSIAEHLVNICIECNAEAACSPIEKQHWYQGGIKATVSGVVEDLKFKISEDSDPNWCFPDPAQLAVSV